MALVVTLSYNSSAFDIHSYLLDLGLTKLQARTYVSLLSLGPAKASTVAKELGIIRPEIYRTLDELSSKGLVERTLAKPSSYNAVEPRRALRALLDRASSDIERIREHFGEALESLSSRGSLSERLEAEFRLLPNRQILIPTVIRMLGRARVYYLAVFSKEAMARFTGDSVERRTIAAAKKRGVRIRIITELDNTNAKYALALTKYAEIRNARNIDFYMDLTDGREVIFGPKLTDSDLNHGLDSVDLWTDSAAFVQAMKGMFDRIWRSSTSLTTISVNSKGKLKSN